MPTSSSPRAAAPGSAAPPRAQRRAWAAVRRELELALSACIGVVLGLPTAEHAGRRRYSRTHQPIVVVVVMVMVMMLKALMMSWRNCLHHWKPCLR